ncbi:hypothetical protein CD798_18045 [Bacillaceae bacterium SAOS 7]|nr:hypothetical protein CD798_18045 [Bacillaceae bacterium SAOS 7]
MFHKKIVDYEEVWGLYKKGWVTTQDENGTTMIPFWPKKEFAQYFACGEWEENLPVSIELNEFIEEWLPNMKKGLSRKSVKTDFL